MIEVGVKNFVHRIAAIFFLIAIFIMAISIGSGDISLLDLLTGSVSSENLEMTQAIFYNIRLPRVLVAGLCGAALASAGVICQGLFKNPLASPTILGTTSGGTLAAALVFYLGASHLHWMTLPIGAFIGASIATTFVLYLSQKFYNWPIENLLLAGFSINAMLGAFTTLIISLVLEDYQKTAAVVHWMLGGFSSRGWEHLQISWIPIFFGFFLALKLTKKLNVLVLGEEVASTLNINISNLKKLSILSIALLVGTSVAIAGALPFIGLVVPHFTRKIFGPENKQLLIFSCINGATLTILADLIARTIRSPLELEVGVLTSIIGAPFFLWALIRGWK